jgi:hypothetical protein
LLAVRTKVLLLVIVTVLDLPVTLPTPPSIKREVASLTSQFKVTLPPPAGKLAGVAVKLVIVGLGVGGVGVGVEALGQAVSKKMKSGSPKSKRRFIQVFLSQQGFCKGSDYQTNSDTPLIKMFN